LTLAIPGAKPQDGSRRGIRVAAGVKKRKIRQVAEPPAMRAWNAT
jgi:hypothetical protein